MATAEVQHPVPTAVHDGSCFQEEENCKVPVQNDVLPAIEVEEEAPGAEEVQLNDNGISEEETKGRDEKDSDKENNPKGHREASESAVATGDDDRLMQVVVQEVEAKLGIVQDHDFAVDDSAAAAADDEATKKLPKEDADERNRDVTAKQAAEAKAAVVPIDDDDGLVHGEAAAASDEALEKEEDEGADKNNKGEELQDEKAHE